MTLVRVEAGKNIKNAMEQRSKLQPEIPSQVIALISGVVLAFSFPKFSVGFLAWVALAPFFYTLWHSKNGWDACLQGALAGIGFFAISIHWLTHVTFFGYLFGILLQSSFWVVAGVAIFLGRKLPSPLRILWTAMAWTGAEVLRANAPIFAFGWNLTAYSQSFYPVILQAANVAGAYGLGCLIALVNAGLAEFPAQKISRKIILGICLIALGAAVTAHGRYWLSKESAESVKNIRISLIQGNIAQEIKWEPAVREKILDIHLKMSELVAFEDSELIIWPEAAFPGYFNRDLLSDRVRDLVRKTSVPMLIGSPHFEEPDNAFNSAYLIGPDGETKSRYDKQHLVPFGEYVPLKLFFGWLEPIAYSLGVSNFSAGHESTVFNIMNNEFKFSTLICFEDVFPSIARKFVERGADFLAVITNDAWFGSTGAPYQHLQASIFRAVENGVPVLRAANTGISSYVSSKGIELKRLQGQDGDDLFVTARSTFELPVEKIDTIYKRGGWIFEPLMFSLFVLGMIVLFGINRMRG